MFVFVNIEAKELKIIFMFEKSDDLNTSFKCKTY